MIVHIYSVVVFTHTSRHTHLRELSAELCIIRIMCVGDVGLLHHILSLYNLYWCTI